MEKKTAHTRLSIVQELVTRGAVTATNSAMNCADNLGLSFDDMCDAISNLTTADFYKSMTTYNDHTIWQDVYKPTLACGKVYLKVTVKNNVLIVSFKEDTA